MQSYKKSNQNKISEEEEKIRGELEMDIEKDLEGEIKDEIYRLALRLHRLYQHQRDKQSSTNKAHQGQSKHQQRNKNKAFSEVNINIKMDGGTKVEIKEITKKPSNVHNNHNTPVWSHRNEFVHDTTKNNCSHNNSNGDKVYVINKHSSSKDHKKFDWANSLRSGPSNFSHNNVVRNKIQAGGKENPRTPKENNLAVKKEARPL